MSHFIAGTAATVATIAPTVVPKMEATPQLIEGYNFLATHGVWIFSYSEYMQMLGACWIAHHFIKATWDSIKKGDK